MAEPLKQLAARLLRDRRGTIDTLTVPHLLWLAPPSERFTETWERTTAGGARPRPAAGDPLVFRVEKQAHLNNAFAMAVTIGRISSNDIQLDDESVSRFHAYLQLDPRTARWCLTDASSATGTFIKGARLAPGVKTPLLDDTAISFGAAEARFLMPGALVAFLE